MSAPRFTAHLLASLTLAQLACSPQLHAQAQPAPAAENRTSERERAVADGLQQFGRKQYAAARASFARAHALQPSARTLRVLGMTDFALDDFTLAREELDAALTSRVEPLTAAQRSEVEELLGWMQSNLGKVQLILQPLAAQASIDDRAADRPEIWLVPGEHRLRVTAPGHIPLERSFTLALGSEPLPLHVRLAPALSAPDLPLTAATPARSSLWIWLGSGGLACLAASGVLLGVGLSESHKVEHTSAVVTADAIESRARRADWLTGTGIGLGIVGAAGVTAALYSLLRDDREQPVGSAFFYDVGPLALQVGQRF